MKFPFLGVVIFPWKKIGESISRRKKNTHRHNYPPGNYHIPPNGKKIIGVLGRDMLGSKENYVTVIVKGSLLNYSFGTLFFRKNCALLGTSKG